MAVAGLLLARRRMLVAGSVRRALRQRSRWRAAARSVCGAVHGTPDASSDRPSPYVPVVLMWQNQTIPSRWRRRTNTASGVAVHSINHRDHPREHGIVRGNPDGR